MGPVGPAVPVMGYINNQSVIKSMPSSSSPLMPLVEEAPRQRRERRKEARPGELLDAALTLFVEKGFAATRVEEVAAAAGVSKGTLFLYFPSKEELFKAVVRETIAGRFGEWNEELDAFEGSSAELLRYCMQAWWERIGMTAASGITKLVMSEAGSFPEIAAFYTQAVIEPGNALVRSILERGVRRGDVHILPHTSGERLWRAKRFLPHKLYSNLFQRSLGRMKPRGQR